MATCKEVGSFLTSERLRGLVDYDPLTGIFTHKDGHLAGRPSNSDRYWCIRVDSVPYLAHRLAWLYVHGRWPTDELDHINGDGTDNRMANLRPAKHAENLRNMKLRRDNTIGLKGVYRPTGRRKFTAQIRLPGGRKTNLGTYDTAEEAHAVYIEHARRLFGEFARVG